MPDEIKCSVNVHWAAGERGVVTAEGVQKTIEFSAPPEFHGEAGFWTPEQFLLAAVASCFSTTFRAIAGFSKFDPVALQIAVEGTLTKNPSGYDFASVVIRPLLTIHDESERPRALRLLEKTEHGCLVARSLKCGVTMEASVESLANATGGETVTAPVR
jgi:organic hydroperoxide reductase OsmC/OhrA